MLHIGVSKMKAVAIHMNYSPLRYPGGKTKIAPLVEQIMQKAGIVNGTYIEPFAGGGGVALALLLRGKVQNIVINDYDKTIYAFWHSVVFETERFIKLLKKTPVTINEWHNQKKIFEGKTKSLLKLGFAMFFLNRTNRSGILKAGPIGGYDQSGNYLVDARFNKAELIKKISRIGEYREHIFIYNLEIRDFIKNALPNYKKNSFVYFDPPYFKKGKELYINFFKPEDHKEIADMIFKLDVDWMVTYDDVEEIKIIYDGKEQKKFDLNYSVANKGKNSEIIVLNRNLWPAIDAIDNSKINLRQGEETWIS